MDPGHRGHHSVTAYTCDGCGKRRRYPWRQQDEEGITLCFLCTVRDDRRYAFMP
jgi:RNase P subunit RPR2